jgi:hypothetical protein
MEEILNMQTVNSGVSEQLWLTEAARQAVWTRCCDVKILKICTYIQVIRPWPSRMDWCHYCRVGSWGKDGLRLVSSIWAPTSLLFCHAMMQQHEHPHMPVPCSETYRPPEPNKHLLLINHPACGILLQQQKMR